MTGWHKKRLVFSLLESKYYLGRRKEPVLRGCSREDGGMALLLPGGLPRKVRGGEGLAMPWGRAVTVTQTGKAQRLQPHPRLHGLPQSPQPSGKLARFLTPCPHVLWRPDVPNGSVGLGSRAGLTVSVSAFPAPRPLKASSWLSCDSAPFRHLSRAERAQRLASAHLAPLKGPWPQVQVGGRVSTTEASRHRPGTADPAWPVRPLLRRVWPARVFHEADQQYLSRDCLSHSASRPPGLPIPGRPACGG